MPAQSPRPGLTPEQNQADVILVTMPYASLECASAALGVLKAALTQAGISSEVVYANLLFSDLIGIDAYRFLNIGHRSDLIGEWTFAGAAFPGFAPDMSHHLEHLAKYFCKYYERKPGPDSREKMVNLFQGVRDQAQEFVTDLAQSILAKKPKVVGCSSSFEQHLASLALLRRVRELAPEVVTILGGANCEDAMGLASMNNFPWLDLVFSGEADSVMGELCALLIEHGRDFPAERLPWGAMDSSLAAQIAARPREEREIPRPLTQNLDDMPLPDYGEFMKTLERVDPGGQIIPGLMLETSRGCWWGRCTFCGLNGCGKRYRSKSPERIIREIETLAERYGVESFGLSDTVISKAFWRQVLPHYARGGRTYNLFFETRSDLSEVQVALLAAAGVRWVQPGIEGMHDSILGLMDKGVRAMDNVQMLKFCRRAGIFVIWHLLVGFPGEDDAWHQETTAWLPLIYHLQPVQGVKRIRFDRFCEYQKNPQAHGLEIEPFGVYRNLFPLDEEALEDLAYYFRDVRPHSAYHSRSPVPPGIAALRSCQAWWHSAFYGKQQARLSLRDQGERLVISDTRPCAPAPEVVLQGLEARVLRACASAGEEEEIARRLHSGGAAPSDEEIAAALASLIGRKLVLELSGRYLGLALEGEPPILPGRESFPMGSAPIPLVDNV